MVLCAYIFLWSDSPLSVLVCIGWEIKYDFIINYKIIKIFKGNSIV